MEKQEKTETVEEKEPYWDLVDKKAEQNNTIDLDAYAKGVQDGVKWQAERLYSEDDMRRAYSYGMFAVTTGRNFKDWFINYKSK
jgi:hypothetical protein